MAKLPRIPDLLTTANLCCGVGSILLASQGKLEWACWLVFIGAGFDVLDGLAARVLSGGSELGKQLDSMADMVTFGVAPAMLIWFYHSSTPWDVYSQHVDQGGPEFRFLPQWEIVVTVIILVVASAWRLAKFNIDDRQSVGFLGLPTPSNGLFWVTLTLGTVNPSAYGGLCHDQMDELLAWLMTNNVIIILLSVIMAALMLSSIPLPSLKFKHFSWQGNQVVFMLIGIGILLVILFGVLAIPLILLLYLLSPLWGKLFPKDPDVGQDSTGSP